MYCDFHTHLNHETLYPTRSDYLQNFVQAGGTKICLIGVDDTYNTRGLQICQDAPKNAPCQAVCSIGYHPETVVNQTLTSDHFLPACHQLKNLYHTQSTHIVAIGECGIDVHRPGGKQSLDDQKQLFAFQCDLAQELKLPVVIHSRDDRASTRDIVQLYPDLVFYRHCRSYDSDKLQIIQKHCRQYMIGYTGVITYPSAKSSRECLSQTPLSHIALETDAPYLAPVPHRGSSNQPSYIVAIYDYIAQYLDIDITSLSLQISQNFDTLYHRSA